MEVIAATSGITSLLSFGLQVSQGLFQLYNTVKNAPSDLKGIYQDMQSLCGVLTHLQEQLGEHSIPGSKKRFSANLKVLTPALDHCQTLFSELQGKLEAANGLLRNEEASSSGEKLKPSSFLKDRFRPIWERAKWPFTKDDLVKIRSRLEDAKSTLNLCLVIILVTPQLKSDIGKDNEFERKKATAAVVEAFREQQRAKQQAAAVENLWPSQVNASITSRIPAFQAASSLDSLSRDPNHDQKPRDNIGGEDSNNMERIKTEISTTFEERDMVYDELIAWISVASQSGRENLDLTPVATRVRLPQKEIKTILRDNPIPLLRALSQLNDKQRTWVTSQANELGGTLVHVSRWTTTPMETVFGNINMTSLFWITESASRVLSPEAEIESGYDQINAAVNLARSSRPRFLDAVRRRLKRSSQSRQGSAYSGKEGVIAEDTPARSESKPEPEYEHMSEEREPQIKIAIQKLEREKRMLKFSDNSLANMSGNNKASTPATYSPSRAAIDEVDEDNEVPHEEEKLVEKLVSEWINVYDEPYGSD